MTFMLMSIYIDISIFAFKNWQKKGKLSPKAFINTVHVSVVALAYTLFTILWTKSWWKWIKQCQQASNNKVLY